MRQILDSNSPDKLRHTRSVAYLVELVVLNKHQISGGGPYLDGYLLDRLKTKNYLREYVDKTDLILSQLNITVIES